MHPPASPPSAAAAASTAPQDLQIDRARRTICLRGRHIQVGARAFDLLATLAAKPGRVFSGEELIQAVWPGRVVDETNLRAQIRKLRQSIGSHRIVNVSGRGYVYSAAPGSQAPGLATRSLPLAAAELLGRDNDCAAVGELLAAHPLVTLLGSGGVGKTQVALFLARQAQAERPENVWWVELASLGSTDRIALAMAQTIGLQPGALDGSDAGTRLGAALSGHEGLLVLDNAEHAASALAGLLQGVMAQARGLRLLVTSQQRLKLPTEKVYRLEPLETQPALQLLLRRAQSVDHRFRFEAQELEPAARLCQQLDRLPLALEMAGARLPMLGLQVLQQHLSERLRLLGTEQAAGPERQRTLQSALAWSHAMLTPEEQKVFRRLSVFAGPFRLESAQHLAADEALDAVAVARAVSELVDKSLLQCQAPEGAAAVRRWRLLETPRLFASRQLDEQQERAATEARHAQTMAVLGAAALAAFWTCGDHAWLQAWRADHDDFLLGFDRACTAGDAESAALLSEVLDCQANITGLYGPMVVRVDVSLALLPQGQALARARLWNRTVWPCGHLSRLDAARRRLQAWRLAGEPLGLAEALAWCVVEEELAGHRGPADSLLVELSSIDQTHWTPRQRMAGGTIARVMFWMLRDDEQALREATLEWQTLSLRGALTRHEVQALALLAFAEALERRPEQALPKIQRTVAEHRAMGSFEDAAFMLGHQAMLMLTLNDRDAARDLLEQALMTSDAIATLSRLTSQCAALAMAHDQAALAERLLCAAASFERWQISPLSAWERRLQDELRLALDSRLDAGTRARCRAEGGLLTAAQAHRFMLDWLGAAR